MQGFILEVTTSPSGDELARDHVLGETVIEVTEVEDFDQVEGGSVSINGTVYDYTLVDPVLLTLTLASPLIEDLLDSEKVLLSPLVVEKWAMVEVQRDEDPISALVPNSLWDRIPEGVREPEDQEAIIVDVREGDLVVVDIVGSAPTVDGGFTDPGTSPLDPATQALLDELAAQVQDNAQRLTDAETDIQNTSETAFEALDTAATADGRISISDYEPGPEDVAGRNEGSLWFTRTRARFNYCTNPSFEVNTADWASTQASYARVTPVTPVAIDGTTVLEITNSGVAGAHYVSWVPGAGQAAVPGQFWTASVYANLVSGIGAGCLMTLGFYDASFVPTGFYSGPVVDLLVGDYQRLHVTAQAPANTAWVVSSVGWVGSVGVEGTVWQIDGMQVEPTDTLGRYFDGSSYDAHWLGAINNSGSAMEGGKIIRMFELDDGAWILKQISGDVLQDINASEITQGAMDGERIQDNSIPIDKMSGTPGFAAEDLDAGNLVSVVNEGGATKIYKADATLNRPAHGFVLAGVLSGGVALVYSYGYNPFLFGLTPGPAYLSSTTPGAVANAAPIIAGRLSQRVGVCVGSTTLNFLYSTPIRII